MSDKQNRITPEGDILAPCELYEKATHIEIDGRLEKLSGSTGTMFWIGEGAGQQCLSDLKVASWNWIIRKYRFMKVVGMRPLRFYGLKVGNVVRSPGGSLLLISDVELDSDEQVSRVVAGGESFTDDTCDDWAFVREAI